MIIKLKVDHQWPLKVVGELAGNYLDINRCKNVFCCSQTPIAAK